MRIIFLCTLLFGILGILLLPMFILDQKPMFKTNEISKLIDLKAETKRALFPKEDPSNASNFRRVTITISELNILLKILKKDVTFRLKESRFGLVVGLMIEAPFLRDHPVDKLGRLINIRFLLIPSEDKIDVARLAIGKLEIPHILIQRVVTTMLTCILGSKRQKMMSRSFRLLDIRGQKFTFQFGT